MVRLTDRPDMTLDVYRGHKTTMQQQQQLKSYKDKQNLVVISNEVYESSGSPKARFINTVDCRYFEVEGTL